MDSIYDCYTLNNGMQIPCVGFGTYKAMDTDSVEVTKCAIEAGYRYFDTASLYGTEEDLGKAIKESGIPREEFFIVSKLWTDEMGYEGAKAAYERSLKRLQLDYLDLYLIHWPRPSAEYADWKKLDVETWKALEDLYKEKKVRGIGLSNFLPHHIDNILEHCSVKPLVDQLELHPGYAQEAALAYLKEHDIQPQAWSPLGRGGRSELMQNPFIMELAGKYEEIGRAHV